MAAVNGRVDLILGAVLTLCLRVEGVTGSSCNSSTSCDDPCRTISASLCDLNTTSTPLDSNRAAASGVAIIVLVIGVLIVGLLCVILGFLLYRKRRRKRNADLASMHYDNSTDAVKVKDCSSSQLNDKPETMKKGCGNEREFKNSIYGHDLVSTAYSDTAVGRSSSGNDQYDVTHPPSNQYDVAHLPKGQYNKAHPPSDQYDVAHVPNNQYDVAHPPVHLPTNKYNVAHLPGNDQYDVAHPPTIGMGHPSEDQYDVAHPPPMSGCNDVLVKAAGNCHMKGTSAQSNPYGKLCDDQYDVAHPPPSNNYYMITGQDAQYDVHVPNNRSRVAGNQHLHSNPRYESC